MTGTVALMPIRYPAPLRAGDRIGVTSPSSGVPDDLWPRFTYAVDFLRHKGFDVVVGELNHTSQHSPSHVSGPSEARAAELTAMLLDPSIRAVVPPWGGETCIDLLELLDLDAVAAAEPTWCVGFSDTSTWLTPLTVTTGIATIHGQNLMDTPYRLPDGTPHWLDVAGAPPGGQVVHRSAGVHRTTGHDDYAAHPDVTDHSLDGRGGWVRLDAGSQDDAVTFAGRLVAGCVEAVSFIAGGRFADIEDFADAHAPDGIVHVLDVAEWAATDICRALHAMRLRGWFDRSTGILVSRTSAPGRPDFSQHDAVRDALGGLGVPIVADVECGHVPPAFALVQGAETTVSWDGAQGAITQRLT
jgi:muramoyltetrapeptide carboxypeptidase